MKNATRRLGLAVAVLGLIVVAAGRARAGLVLDQQFTAGLSRTSTSSIRLAQTFTVGVTGTLERIEIQVKNLDGVTLDVLSTISGVPAPVGTTPLASVSLANVFAQDQTWVTADLHSAGIQVTAGQVLAYSLRGTFMEVDAASGEATYAGGGAFASTPVFNYVSINQDFRFLTYVDSSHPVSAVPEPSTIALVFTALPMGLGFAWKRRRKAVAV